MDSATASSKLATYEVSKFGETDFAIRSSLKGDSSLTRKLGKLQRRTGAIIGRTGHSTLVTIRFTAASVKRGVPTAQEMADYFARI